jgi:Domain of unknown function (DUF5658)
VLPIVFLWQLRCQVKIAFRAGFFNRPGGMMKSALLTVLLLVGVAHAQQNFIAANPLPNAPGTQKFWDRENKIDFSILAGQITVDAITTQHGLNEGFRETNPVMRPLVTRGAAGEAAASAIGLGFGVGTAYFLHVTHHYKAERIATRTMLAVEGGFVANNLLRLY